METKRASLKSAAPWLAFAVGFSPGLAELVRSWCWMHAGRPTLVGAALLVLALAKERTRAGRRVGRIGPALVAVALAVELLGTATRSGSLARLAVPPGALGMALWLGAPAPRAMALAFFAVPLPFFAELAASRAWVGWLAAAAARIVGPPIEAHAGLLAAPAGRIEAVGSFAGVLALTQMAAAFGWLRGLARGAGVLGLAGRAALAAPAGPLLQALAMLAAALELAAGRAASARVLGAWGVWSGAGCIGLAVALFAWRPPRSSPSRAEGTPP